MAAAQGCGGRPAPSGRRPSPGPGSRRRGRTSFRDRTLALPPPTPTEGPPGRLGPLPCSRRPWPSSPSSAQPRRPTAPRRSGRPWSAPVAPRRRPRRWAWPRHRGWRCRGRAPATRSPPPAPPAPAAEPPPGPDERPSRRPGPAVGGRGHAAGPRARAGRRRARRGDRAPPTAASCAAPAGHPRRAARLPSHGPAAADPAERPAAVPPAAEATPPAPAPRASRRRAGRGDRRTHRRELRRPGSRSCSTISASTRPPPAVPPTCRRPSRLDFLPYGYELDRLTAAAAARGHDVFLHMPLEPIGDADPGPNALLTSLAPAEVARRLAWDFAGCRSGGRQQPHGQPRHGRPGPDAGRAGRGQAPRPRLRRQPDHPLERRPGIAGRLGLPFATRNVFLDNEPTADAVQARLAEAERLARRTAARSRSATRSRRRWRSSPVAARRGAAGRPARHRPLAGKGGGLRRGGSRRSGRRLLVPASALGDRPRPAADTGFATRGAGGRARHVRGLPLPRIACPARGLRPKRPRSGRPGPSAARADRFPAPRSLGIGPGKSGCPGAAARPGPGWGA